MPDSASLNPSPPTLSLSEKKRMPFWLELLLLVALLGLVFSLAKPGMTSEPILDDDDGLKYAATFTTWQDTLKPDSYGLFRPVKSIIFYWFHLQDSISLGLWHGVIIFFFLGATASLHLMLRTLTRAPLLSLAATAAWATSPTQVCAAIWMSCINISIATLLITLFILSHRRATQSGKKLSSWSFLGAVILFLAQCSYEAAVSLVALAFLYDQLIAGAHPLRQRIINYALYGITTTLFLCIRLSVGSTASNVTTNYGFEPDLERWQLALSAPWFMLMHLLMWAFPPGRIEFISSYFWGKSATMADLGLAGLVIAGLFLAAWFLRKRVPWFSFGIFWFFLTSFPSSNFIPIFAGPIEDYYLIIPSIGLAIALVSFIHLALHWQSSDASSSQSMPAIPALVLIAAIGLWRLFYLPVFASRAESWNHPINLYLLCVDTRPHQHQAKALAARELFQARKYQEAITLAQEAQEEAPWNPLGPMVLGFSQAKTGHHQKALESLDLVLQQAVPPNPLASATLLEIARIQITSMKDWQGARDSLKPILQNKNDRLRPRAIHLMADLYLAQGNTEKALTTLERGHRLYPRDKTFPERHAQLTTSPRP